MEENSENCLIKAEDDGLFYFESDHLALKGNTDYCDVLKTIVLLCAQREKALKDFSQIVEIKQKCLEDPVETIRKLQNGEDLNLPPLMELPKLPVINFNKYDTKIPESDIKSIYLNTQEETTDEKRSNEFSGSNNHHHRSQKAWSHEEQKRLEELLLIYPPEPIEMRRFQKIAAALGNRSVKQVTSRVQKYFIKLYQAGLPIPGRIPKKIEKYKKSFMHKHQKFNHYLFKPTTFFPNLHVPVTMDDGDDSPGPSISAPPADDQPQSTVTSQNYLMPCEMMENVEEMKSEGEMQLMLLKRVREEKVVEKETDGFRHVGYKCDFCNTEPITGSRWHCTVCTDSIDFCTDCVVTQMYSNAPHPLHHVLGVHRNDKTDVILPESSTSSESDDGSDDTDTSSMEFNESESMDGFKEGESEEIN